MLKKRIIPVLLLRNGFLVQSKRFKRFQNVGNPVSAVKRLSEWGADELIYLDISRDPTYDMRRDDLGHENRTDIFEILEDVSRVTFMPITMGGRIASLDDVEARLRVGADKVAVNTMLYENKAMVEAAARTFGSQCIVASIDVKSQGSARSVWVDRGRVDTSVDPVEWAKRAVGLGAGEILLNSIDRDGTRTGYDLELVGQVAEAVSVPVIALGGCGEWHHLEQVLTETGAEAAAAANIFHFVDQSVHLAKKHLFDSGLAVRRPALHTFSIKGRELHD